jgi:ATP-dependent Clp protease ATP-binding subunit ClpC
MEKFAVSRLVGAPPGYVGYEEGGLLTEKIRRKPYSVVLLDEIEKAHPDVFNLMLQVLDEGFLTDSLGRKIDFRNTIIIMTSNIGSRQLKNFGTGMGFSTTAKINAHDLESRGVIEKALKKFFAPEFLNRIDDVIVFESLKKEHIEQILEISISRLLSRIENVGFKLKLNKAAKDFIVEKGFDADFGARPLNRAIQRYVEDPLAEEILRSAIDDGDVISVGLDKKLGQLTFKKTSPGKSEKVKGKK